VNVWKFIDKRSSATRVKDQLHAIWYLCCSFLTTVNGYVFYRYCIPMDSPRPLLSAELEFFAKGIGKGESCNQLLTVMIFG